MGNKMAQVAFLRKILSMFQRRKAVGYAFSDSKRRRRICRGDCEEDELINGIQLPIDIPRGHFAVYVGSERSRFIVPTAYLNDPLFIALLEKAREEYGFHYDMGITIPCGIVVFEHLTSVLGKKDFYGRNYEIGGDNGVDMNLDGINF